MITFITLNEKDITDFAKERNNLIKKSKADWIFFVDSDEVIPKELKGEISKINFNTTKYNGFYVKRKIVFLGKRRTNIFGN